MAVTFPFRVVLALTKIHIKVLILKTSIIDYFSDDDLMDCFHNLTIKNVVNERNPLTALKFTEYSRKTRLLQVVPDYI